MARHRYTELPISRRDVEQALRYARSVTARATSKDGSTMGVLLRQGTSAAAAFGYGVVEGRFGPQNLGPVSVDLLTAILLNVAGFSGIAGDYSGHAHNVAQGLLDGYAHRMGVGLGDMWKNPTATPQAQPTKVSGVPKTQEWGINPSPTRSLGPQAPLTAAEIATMGQVQFAGRRR